MYVCMYVRMYVCMHVCLCILIVPYITLMYAPPMALFVRDMGNKVPARCARLKEQESASLSAADPAMY